MTSEFETLDALLERHFAATERRLRAMVNERNTNVINAATVIVSGIKEELHSTAQALESLSAHLTAGQSALTRRVEQLETRLDRVEDRLDQVEDQLAIAPVDRTRPLVRAELARVEARMRMLLIWSFGLGIVADLIVLLIALFVR